MREINEDSVYAAPIPASAEGDPPPARHLLMVADGVGGLERGEWASEQAVAVAAAEMPAGLNLGQPDDALRRAFQAANERIWREVSSAVDLHSGPVATTLVAILLEQRQLWWANVGDSRAYLVGEQEVHQLTRDHSWMEEQVRSGALTPEQARLSERRNVITRGVGFQAQVEVDTGGPIPVSKSDRVVLCSDGLHGLVSEAEIASLARTFSPAEAAERMIALSNERGGVDNISVVVCGFVPETIPTAQQPDSIDARTAGRDPDGP